MSRRQGTRLHGTRHAMPAKDGGIESIHICERCSGHDFPDGRPPFHSEEAWFTRCDHPSHDAPACGEHHLNGDECQKPRRHPLPHRGYATVWAEEDAQ